MRENSRSRVGLDIFLVCLTGFALIWCIAPVNVIGFDLLAGVLAAVLFGLLFSGMLRSRVFALAVGAVLVIAAAAVLLQYRNDPASFAWLTEGPTSYFSWIEAMTSGFIRENARWEALTLFILSALPMFLVALLLRAKRAIVPFAVCAVAGMGALVAQRALSIETDPISVFVFALAAILLFMRVTYPKQIGRGYVPGRLKYTAILLPFICVGLLFGSMLYNHDEHTDRSILKRIQEFIELVRPKYVSPITYFDYFSISDMGYDSGEQRLGGAPHLSGDAKLFIIADKPAYLAGRTSYDYTGTSWDTNQHEWFRYENQAHIYDFLKEDPENEAGVDTDPSHLDAMEMRFGQAVLYPEISGALPAFPATLRKQTIIFGSISTKTIFTAQNTMTVLLGRALTNHQDSKMLNIDAEQLLTGGQQDKDFYYEIQFMETNLSYAQRQELLRLSYHGLYRDVAEDEEKLNGFSAEYAAFLADYSDWIHEEYTGLPDAVPERVRALAAEIVEGLDNDYDKAQAIRDYLVDHYEYSFEVPETPAEREFVDYFLFDLKKGYCSYFATSMAVLSRAAGLPVRYVEGFRPETRMLDDTYYFATGFNAHAWVEIYFEGYGWVAYEATPPYRYDFDFYFLSREAMAETFDDTYYDDTPYYEINPEEEEAYEWSPDQEIESMRFIVFFVTLAKVVVVLVCVALAVGLILIVINLIRRRRRQYFDATTDATVEYVIKNYRYMLKILSELDLPKGSDETPIEHGERIDAKEIRDFEHSVAEASRVYSAAVYGQKSPSPDEAESLYGTIFDLLIIAKRRYGSVKFFFMQHILNRF